MIEFCSDNFFTNIITTLRSVMTYIIYSRKGDRVYYSLSKSQRSSVKPFPIQKTVYLGRYHNALEKIKLLEDSEEERERLIKELNKKELNLNGYLPIVNNVKYDCIVIDPPWFYTLRNNDKTHRNRIPYPPMKIEEILKLPVPSLCNESGSVLWLWFTNNHVIEAVKCIEEWGFSLKTILTWEKVSKKGTPRIGTGHWLRNCTEHCILAVKGKVSSFSHSKTLTNESTVLRAQRREHSRKPDEFYVLVEKLCPGSKLEMFARQEREGWDSWGNETTKFN